jgi:S1-C subfamily serine protease
MSCYLTNLIVAIFAAVTAYGNVPTASIQPLQVSVDGVDATMCTVFSINEQAKYWATAAHCVLQMDDEGATHKRPVLIGGKPTVVMMSNQVLDVAVLRAEVSAPAIPFGNRPALGDPVRVYGYMWGVHSPTLFFGRIANLNADHFMILDMRVGGGHSGSPILDAAGHVVSVMQVSSMGFSGGALYGYLDELLPYWQ